MTLLSIAGGPKEILFSPIAFLAVILQIWAKCLCPEIMCQR